MEQIEFDEPLPPMTGPVEAPEDPPSLGTLYRERNAGCASNVNSRVLSSAGQQASVRSSFRHQSWLEVFADARCK